MNNTSQENTRDLSSFQDEQTELNPLPPLLPRSAWKSQRAYLKFLFRAKKALDKLETDTDFKK